MQNMPIRSLFVIPNLVEVGAMVVIACGNTYALSIAITSTLLLEYEDISELWIHYEQYIGGSKAKRHVPHRLVVDPLSLIQLNTDHPPPLRLSLPTKIIIIIMIDQPIFRQ
jgi:hypothetical protein